MLARKNEQSRSRYTIGGINGRSRVFQEYGY
jgi:hypothetical protein